jgi:hypothetical protein
MIEINACALYETLHRVSINFDWMKLHNIIIIADCALRFCENTAVNTLRLTPCYRHV